MGVQTRRLFSSDHLAVQQHCSNQRDETSHSEYRADCMQTMRSRNEAQSGGRDSEVDAGTRTLMGLMKTAHTNSVPTRQSKPAIPPPTATKHICTVTKRGAGNVTFPAGDITWVRTTPAASAANSRLMNRARNKNHTYTPDLSKVLSPSTKHSGVSDDKRLGSQLHGRTIAQSTGSSRTQTLSA
jgi:hypothetical protein